MSIELHNLIVIVNYNAYTVHAEQISFQYIQSALISYRVTRTFDVLTVVSNIQSITFALIVRIMFGRRTIKL